MSKKSLVWVVVLPLLGAGACGDDGGGDEADAAVAQADSAPAADAGPQIDAAPAAANEISCDGQTIAATVTTEGFAFTPNALTINAGDVVEFNPGATHNATSGAPGATTGFFTIGTSPTENHCVRFNDPGDYDWFCSVHPAMTGVVTVQ